MMNKTISPVPYLSETIRILQHFDKTLRPKQVIKPQPSEYLPFNYTLDRTVEGEGEIPLEIEVTDYREPGNNKYLDHRDPNFDPGYITFGTAVNTDTGMTVELTPTELDTIERAFWND